jgi:hypothetical protein
MRVEERMQPAFAFMPKLASLNMGSMKFGALSDFGTLSPASDTHGSATT